MRTMRRLAIAAFIALAATVPGLVAQTVEVSMMEKGASAEGASSRSSELVIAGILDGLFESGFIATNARPTSGDAAAFAAFSPGADSVEGFVDFVILVLADYAGEAAVPACRFRVLVVPGGGELGRGEVPAAAPASAATDDIEEACMAVGSAISAACGGALRGVSASRGDDGYEEA